MKNKVLIITYYWPPAGGPGVQRWLKFVTYLTDFNIEPIVYIPENPNYPIVDTSLLQEIPQTVTVLKQPIKEPYKWARLISKKSTKTISKGIIQQKRKQRFIERLLLYIRGNFYIPDARIAWVKPSVIYLKSYIEKHNIKTIITTGPPHSLHLIGLQLQTLCNVKWLADFRDPWTQIGYHKQLKLTHSARKKHKSLEKQVLQTANHIIVTSKTTKSEFQTITKQPISVITNGYDTQYPTQQVTLDKAFTISHIGSLLSERNPEILWHVLSELIRTDALFAKDFKLQFIGSVSQSVLTSIKRYNLQDYVLNLGYVNHQQAVIFQQKSQVLLLIEINSEITKRIIPGKLFEYMAARRPIIAIGPKDSDVEPIITSTNTGRYFQYTDFNQLKSTILEYYKAYKEATLQVSPVNIEKFSRKALTKQLSKLL